MSDPRNDDDLVAAHDEADAPKKATDQVTGPDDSTASASVDKALTDSDRQFLKDHGASDEVLDRMGVYSITDVAQLPEEFESYGEMAVPAIAFVWRSPSGVEVIQLRPWGELLNKKG